MTNVFPGYWLLMPIESTITRAGTQDGGGSSWGPIQQKSTPTGLECSLFMCGRRQKEMAESWHPSMECSKATLFILE